MIGCRFAVTAFAVVVLAGCASTSSSSSSGNSKPDADASAQLACAHFHDVVADEQSGVLTDAELRDKLKEVYDKAKYSTNAGIPEGARDMLAAVTQGDAAGLRQGLDKFSAACDRVGQ